jgi:AcrR family transcriptional regulator
MLAEASLTTRIAQGGIVAAAAGVFARLGYEATRVEDILEAAGIARRTFYKYFKSKDEVLAALYELATGELLKAVRASGAAPDPIEGIKQTLDLYLDYHVENAALLRVLTEQAIRSESPLFESRRRFRDELGKILDDALRARGKKGNDPMLYAAMLSAIEGLSLELLATGSDPAQVKRAKKVMGFVMTRVLGDA